MAYHPDSPDRDNEESRDALDNIQSNFQHLEEIADNIPEILGGSIVDDNLDDDNPSNGYYAKWEIGLQICWMKFLLSGSGGELVESITFPSDFASAPRGFPAIDVTGSAGFDIQPERDMLGAVHFSSSQADSADIGIYRVDGKTDFGSDDEIPCSVIIIGRWK